MAGLAYALYNNDSSVISNADNELIDSVKVIFNALKKDHPEIELNTIHPMMMVVDYRYRIEFLDNDNNPKHELSFDHISSIYELPVSYNGYKCDSEIIESSENFSIELETLWNNQGSKSKQLSELITLCAMLNQVPELKYSTSSKGGSSKIKEIILKSDEIKTVEISENDFVKQFLK